MSPGRHVHTRNRRWASRVWWFWPLSDMWDRRRFAASAHLNLRSESRPSVWPEEVQLPHGKGGIPGSSVHTCIWVSGVQKDSKGSGDLILLDQRPTGFFFGYSRVQTSRLSRVGFETGGKSPVPLRRLYAWARQASGREVSTPPAVRLSLRHK
ncbi:hypothetical protein F4821DRAFT_221614 [Hypoxylon rubiginosum]|uniref:Uncharacterized protein n=1 Tax=Hypoxylon rubiginosum TaxID=110542 RepID=A0ACC0DN17_9PEZI|nr:hypothetical protein F4821DRAFT_221614 [Hypoxylon rubiginosum]